MGIIRTGTIIEVDFGSRYAHGAWNRLVTLQKQDDGQSAVDGAEYAYNGLNWRMIEQADTDLTDENCEPDQQGMMYDSANPGIGQLLEGGVWEVWNHQAPGDIGATVDGVHARRGLEPGQQSLTRLDK